MNENEEVFDEVFQAIGWFFSLKPPAYGIAVLVSLHAETCELLPDSEGHFLEEKHYGFGGY